MKSCVLRMKLMEITVSGGKGQKRLRESLGVIYPTTTWPSLSKIKRFQLLWDGSAPSLRRWLLIGHRPGESTYFALSEMHFASLFTVSSVGRESACSARDQSSIPGLGRSTGEGNGRPLQYSYLGNPMDRGAGWATAYGIPSVRHKLEKKSSSAADVVMWHISGKALAFWPSGINRAP